MFYSIQKCNNGPKQRVKNTFDSLKKYKNILTIDNVKMSADVKENLLTMD